MTNNAQKKRIKQLSLTLLHGTKCEKCNNERELTIDHIVPLFLIKDMGLDDYYWFDEENLRALCRPCNNLKANHLDFSTPRTKKLLIKYINLI